MKVLTPQDLRQAASAPDRSVWIVEQLLRTNRQRISLLCGSPHAGKSTIARQLAIAVAQGRPFLGRETMKSKVAYWQTEETIEDAVEDFTKSGMMQDDPVVVLHPSPADNHLVELNKVLNEDNDIRLVIIGIRKSCISGLFSVSPSSRILFWDTKSRPSPTITAWKTNTVMKSLHFTGTQIRRTVPYRSLTCI